MTLMHKTAPLFGLLLSSIVISCNHKPASQASHVKVTNGADAGSDYPSVVLLSFPIPNGKAICTGTFVTDSQVVTAGHCVRDLIDAGSSAAAMTFTAGRRKVQAVDLSFNPAFANTGGELDPHDIAVITFPANSAPDVSSFYPQEPAIGDSFVIVGFGRNDYSPDAEDLTPHAGAGIKREGSNKVQSRDGGLITFFGLPTASSDVFAPGEDVASGSGDSGGPLFINGSLAATTSGGGLKNITDASGNAVQVKVSKYVDLNESVNRDYLSRTLTSTPGW